MTRVRSLEVSFLASLLAVALSFAGWGRSGQAVRSSYGLFQAAGRAGVLPDSIEGVGVTFLFVPALFGASLITHALDRRKTAAIGYAVTASMLGTAVVLVVASPLGVESPAVLAGGASVVAVVAALWELRPRSTRRNTHD